MNALSLLMTLSLSLAVGQPTTTTTDPALEGEWVLVSATDDRIENLPNLTRNTPAKLVFTGGQFQWRFAGGKATGAFHADFTVDTSKSPRWINLTFKGAKEEYQGIYSIQGDWLLLCYGEDQGARKRPTKFECDLTHNLWVAQREVKFESLCDLKKWTNPENAWKVAGDALTAPTGAKRLETASDLRDYTLRFEGKAAEATTAGVALRGNRFPEATIQVGWTKEREGKPLYRPHLVFQGKKFEPPYSARLPWFSLEIAVKDNKVTAWLGGAKVMDAVPLPDGSPASGAIALDAADKGFHFHNLRIRPSAN